MADNFVKQESIIRRIWGDPDMVLLVFAGSAAEFALNKAVDWLFFTGKIPNDPIGRLFSTVRYAQEIVFADESTARGTLARINAIHDSVQRQRGQVIPVWAFRDVLYMLIDYSERAHRLLRGPLSTAQREELYGVFQKVGQGLRIPELPDTYDGWRRDRLLHLKRDLAYSPHTKKLYEHYRKHLGEWRYQILLRVQALLVPEEVRRSLRLGREHLFGALMGPYSLAASLGLGPLVRRALIQPKYWAEVERFDRR
jgi:hypothetical protein